MSHNGTGTHQPASMPHDLLSIVREELSIIDSDGTGEEDERAENGVNEPRSLTTDLIGATLLPVVQEEEEQKMEQKDAATTSTGISSERMEEVLKSIQNQEEIFDLQKIRDKIDAKKFSAHDELRKAMAEIARIDYPEPQYVVYANDYIEELQFYIEM